MSLVPKEENQKIYYLIITVFEVQKLSGDETHDTFQEKEKETKITLLKYI